MKQIKEMRNFSMVKVKNYEDYFERVHDLGLYPWYDEDNELVRVMLSDGSNVLSIKTNRTADLITLRQFGNLGYDVKSELLELSTSLALYPTSERGNIPNYENPRFEEDEIEEYQQEEDLDNPFDFDEDEIFNPLELSILGEVLDLINDENEFPEIEEILKLEFDKSTPYHMILEVLDTVFEKFNNESEDDDSELIDIGDEEYVYLVPVDFDCIDLERLKDGPFFVNVATPSYFKYVSDDSGVSFEEVLECYLHGLVVDERGFYEPHDNRFKSKITQKDIDRHGFKENDYIVFKQEDFEKL